MRKLSFNLFGIILLPVLLFLSCKTPKEASYLGVPVSQIQTELNSLLDHFYPRIIDSIHGGYLTNFENDWTLSADQNKMLVTQSRGLWTAARASELFPENKVLKSAADHGFQFLTTAMWDSVYGGFYQYYYPDSAIKNDRSFKLGYGNAFALFGLSQYARIRKDSAVTDWVKKSFYWLESALHDSLYGGYYNIVIPNLDKLNKKDAEKNIKHAGWGDLTMKDQNTSIHLLEAFTATYQVLPDEIVRKRLTEMLQLVRDSMTNSEGYLNLYFNNKWQPISNSDSSREYIIQNPAMDHISFGHNIETAYLLVDASKALYGNPDTLTLRIAKKLIDHTLKYGFDKDYHGLFDKGYKFKSNENTVEVIDSAKVWWAQAEAWHALALFSELYPEEPLYKEAFGKMWTYINENLIDHQYGGWYNSGLDADPGTIKERKAHEWKGCYHDGRALMQVWLYANKR